MRGEPVFKPFVADEQEPEKPKRVFPPREPKLSRRRKQILAFIEAFVAEHRYPPSIRQIGEGVGLSSSSTVHSHLRKLVQLGKLTYDPNKPRSITLTGPAPITEETRRLREVARLARLHLAGQLPSTNDLDLAIDFAAEARAEAEAA